MALISISKKGDTPTRIKELVKNFSLLKKIPPSETIDLSKIEWVTPLSILPIALLITRWQKYGIKIKFSEEKRIKSYLTTILFPKGTEEPTLIEWGETYFPIVRVSHKEEKFPPEVIEKVNDKYQTLLSSLFINQPYQTDLTQALGIFLGEMIDNVEEHSQAHELWILSQYWQRLGELEICLLDDGIGFYNSYKSANITVKDHLEAIDKAVKGISTKKIEGQGYGINRSIYLITESSLNGEFLIISGNAAYFKKSKEMGKLFFLDKIVWRGVIIMIKVKKPYSPINIYKYFEPRI